LSASIIKSVAHIIAEPLSIVINHSFIDAYFPDDLKIAKVIPIFKSGSKSDPSNYRPMSLLNIFSKIFETVINSRILNFLSKHNILNINQFGFRKSHSTEFALIKLTDTITSALNSRQLVCTVTIDLTKAFDTSTSCCQNLTTMDLEAMLTTILKAT
jgi:Reverse transcriptase (RNA-dependent DNA polymerase)